VGLRQFVPGEGGRHDQQPPVGQNDDGLFEQLKRQTPKNFRLEEHELARINGQSDDVFDGTGADALVFVFAYSVGFDGAQGRPLG
jgi:hypothetical protein